MYAGYQEINKFRGFFSSKMYHPDVWEIDKRICSLFNRMQAHLHATYLPFLQSLDEKLYSNSVDSLTAAVDAFSFDWRGNLKDC